MKVKKIFKLLKKGFLIVIGLLLLAGIIFYIKAPYSIIEKAPFDNIYWEGKKVMVVTNGNTYEWLSAEGETLTDIINFSKNKYRDKWKHRIKDDYTMLMHDMGYWVYFNTKVELRNQEGEIFSKNISISRNKREKIKVNGKERNRIKRPHINSIPDSLKYLTHRMDGYVMKKSAEQVIPNDVDSNYYLPMSSWIPADLAINDLEYLEYYLKNKYSYLNLKGVNYQLMIDAIIADLQDGITKRDFGIQIKRLLAAFGDGHTRVSRSYLKMDSLYIPLRIKSVESKFIALGENNTLYNLSYPEITSIDGFSIDSLKSKTGELVAKGSSQFLLSNSLNYITRYGYLKQQLNIENKTTAKIGLSNGNDTIYKKIDLFVKVPRALFSSKKSMHKILDNNLGYIYLHKMEKSKEYQEWLTQTMTEFKDTKGIIIDIRGNGGGNRAPIYTLLPYFIKKPKVINVNSLRINAEDDPQINEAIGGLERRMAYPEKSSHWNTSEKQAIQKFKQDFIPEWELDASQFSKWHYSVVSPNNSYYSKPVIILMDNGNFSASDIFLAAFKNTENITLLGESSGGGSGYAAMLFLYNSGIFCQVSSMASFQPNGKLYDGNGVLPNIEIKETIESIKNQKDIVLEKAIELCN